jgi:hypothetical protein
MPRYYFHLTDGRHACPDEEGLELPNDVAARKEGKLAARDLWSEPADRAWIVQVVDETGRPVARLAATPLCSALRMAHALNDWLKHVYRQLDIAVSSPPPSRADRAPIDPPNRRPERILPGHGADLRETSDRA